MKLAAILTCVISPLALGGQQTLTVTSGPVPLTQGYQAPWGASPWGAYLVAQIPQFNRALGQLKGVTIQGLVTSTGTISVENTSNAPIASDWYFMLRTPNNGSAYDLAWSLGAYDGVVDFAGPSGMTHSIGMGLCDSSGGSLTCYPSVTVPAGSAQLDYYTGSGTVPQSTHFGIYGGPMFGWGSFPQPVVSIAAVASIAYTITYQYDDYPSRFCIGTASNGCPCGITSAGCPNSSNPQGADLVATGNSLVSGGNTVLTASGLPPGSMALFFQGTISQTVGTVFGDGVRCVDGGVFRLGVKPAATGATQLPGPGDPSLSTMGFVPTIGGYRAYQTWYRDSAAFCTAANYNVTNAVAVMWTP